jgi:hypothetical protein
MGGNMKGFLLLLSFMTRIPMPKIEYNEEKLGKSMKYFPAVGVIVGIILLFFCIVFTFVFKNLNYSTVLPLMIIVIILTDLITTGGLHLDGLADTFDGIFSYRSKHKMLEIMKDSRIGSNGVLALILYFLIKCALLYSLEIEDRGEAMYAIMTYPVVSRFCSVISCASAPYARGSGMGKTFVDNTKVNGVIVAAIITLLYTIGLLVAPLVFYPAYVPMNDILQPVFGITFIVGLSALFAYSFSKLMERKIGGITGDTLGALLEISGLLYIFLLLVVPSFF